MLRFLFAFLLAAPLAFAPLAFGQVEIEPFIDASGVTVTPGTVNTIPKWNAAQDDLVDSGITDDGTDITVTASGYVDLYPALNFRVFPASSLMFEVRPTNQAGFGASIVTISPTLNDMDGSDTVYGLNINITSGVGHSGSPNILNALRIGNLVADAEVTESAISIGTGWEQSINIESGQLLLPAGLVGTPSMAWAADNDGTGTGVYRRSADQFSTVVDGVEITRAVSTGLLAISGNVTRPSRAFTNENDTGTWLIGSANMGISVNGALVMDWEDTNAAGASADLVTTSSTTGIMDGADIFRGMVIDIESADHTGGANSNMLIGLDINGIVGDADTKEYGLRFGTGWDSDINFTASGEMIVDLTLVMTLFDTTTQPKVLINGNISDGGKGMALVNTLLAMTGSGTERGLFLDFTNGDHTSTGNLFYALEVDSITEDPDAFESAAVFGSGFDAHFTLVERGGAYADFPPAGSQAFFVDDNADWSGGGGNDCALVWQDSTGATTVIAIRVTDGPCS